VVVAATAAASVSTARRRPVPPLRHRPGRRLQPQADFVSNGSAPYKPYGNAGIGLRKDARLRAGCPPRHRRTSGRYSLRPSSNNRVLRALLPGDNHVHRGDAGLRHERGQGSRTEVTGHDHEHREEGVNDGCPALPAGRRRQGQPLNPTIIGVSPCCARSGSSAVRLPAPRHQPRRPLGFLVAAAGLSGFLVLLTTLWLTTPGNATGNSDLDRRTATRRRGGRRARQHAGRLEDPAVRELPTRAVPEHRCYSRRSSPRSDAASWRRHRSPVSKRRRNPSRHSGSPRRPTTCSRSGSKSYQYIDKTENFFWHATATRRWSCASRASTSPDRPRRRRR